MKLRAWAIAHGVFHLSQAGFLPHRNTHQQAAILYALLAAYQAQGNKLLLGAFLDIEKAFDTIPYDQLLDVLINTGPPSIAVGRDHPPLA